MQKDELSEIREQMRALPRGSDEAKALDRKQILYYDLGQYATAKGYDAIIVPQGNNHYERTPRDDRLKNQGYLVVLNRSAVVVSDTHFEDRDDIFNNGFPDVLAPPVPVEATADEAAAGAEAVAPSAPAVV